MPVWLGHQLPTRHGSGISRTRKIVKKSPFIKYTHHLYNEAYISSQILSYQQDIIHLSEAIFLPGIQNTVHPWWLCMLEEAATQIYTQLSCEKSANWDANIYNSFPRLSTRQTNSRQSFYEHKINQELILLKSMDCLITDCDWPTLVEYYSITWQLHFTETSTRKRDLSESEASEIYN